MIFHPLTFPCNGMAARCGRRSVPEGFTLVEMLCTVGLLCILMMLLSLSLKLGQQKMIDMGCLNNLRQLSAAYLLYVGDNDGCPPPASVTPTHPYSEGHSFAGVCLLRRYYRNGPPYVWTSAGKMIAEPMEKCPSASLMKMGTAYGTSDYLTDKKVLLVFSRLSATPMLWDGWSGNWIAGRTLPLRHRGINCAFLDGHVEHIKEDDGRLYSSWWSNALTKSTPDDSKYWQGTPLGSLTSP